MRKVNWWSKRCEQGKAKWVPSYTEDNDCDSDSGNDPEREQKGKVPSHRPQVRILERVVLTILLI